MDFSPCSSSSLGIITADHHPHQAAAIKSNKRMIVIALVAPTPNDERTPPPPPPPPPPPLRPPRRGRPVATTSVSVFNFEDHLPAEKVISRLNLSGCAVISKGVLVVEGPTCSVERFSRLMGLAQKRPGSVIWQGRVRRPRFGKFSILRHWSSDLAVRKFFADHGASQYWDQVVRSKSNGTCC